MARKSKNISILHFDSQLLSRLCIDPDAPGLSVLSFDQQQGSWAADDGSLTAALQAFAQTHRLAEDRVYTVIPRHDVTTRLLTLPTHDPAEMMSMVQLSAEEFVPFSVHELIIGLCVLEALPSGEARVLAALAHRDVIEGHLALLRQAALVPEKILLSTLCLSSAAVAARPDASGSCALVHLGSAGLEVIVLDKGHFAYGRGVATVQDWSLSGKPMASPKTEPAEAQAESDDLHRGAVEAPGVLDALELEPDTLADSPMPGARALEELAVEVRGSLAAYRRESEDGMRVETVYLCSEWAGVTKASEALSEELGVSCVPADFVKDLIAAGKQHVPVLPAVSLGAALTAQGKAAALVDLTPETITRSRALEAVKVKVLRGLALTAAILVALGALYAQALYQRHALIGDLEQRLAVIEPNARGVAAKREQLHILRRQVDRAGSVLELLAKSFEGAPKGAVNLTRFSYTRERGVDLWGRAITKDDALGFAQNLRNFARGHLAFFAAAKSVYEEDGTERGEPVQYYQIEVHLPEEDDAVPPVSNSR